MHADAFGVAAGEEGGAGGRANRGSHHEAREFSALGSEAVDVGSLDGLGAKAAEVAVALVIGEDDDEVGLVGGRRKEGEDEGKKKGSSHADDPDGSAGIVK